MKDCAPGWSSCLTRSRGRRLQAGARLLPTAIVLLLAWLLMGCHRAPPHRFPTAGAALSRLRESTSCNRAVQGEARLSFSGGGRRLSGRVLYLAHAPAELRFDIFSPFGATISTLTSDGRRFSLLEMEQRAFITGASSACNVQRFTRVPVPPEALVELLRGRPPVLVHETADAKLDFSGSLFGAGHYVLTVAGRHQARQEIEVGVVPSDWDLPAERQRLRLLGVKVEQAGQVLYEVEFSDHRLRRMAPLSQSAEDEALGLSPPVASGPTCEVELADRMRVYVPTTGYELTFRNDELWLNPPLQEGIFVQRPPAGVTVSESSCGSPF
jgi:hypothetical protein